MATIASAVMTSNTVVTSVPMVSSNAPLHSSGGFVPMNHAEKPEKFAGLHFKRWQQKMFFYLTTLNLARYLSEDASQVPEEQTDIQVVSAVEAWKHSDFLCRNYVLNGLVDALYNVYSASNTSKELWEENHRINICECGGALQRL